MSTVIPSARSLLLLAALAALTSCRFVDSARQKWNASRALPRFVSSLEFSRFVHAEFPTEVATYLPEKGLRRMREIPATIVRGLDTAASDTEALLTPPEDVSGRLGRRIDRVVDGPQRIDLLHGGMHDLSDPQHQTGTGPLDPEQQKSQPRRVLDRLRADRW